VTVNASVVRIVTTMPYTVDSYQGLLLSKTDIFTAKHVTIEPCVHCHMCRREMRCIHGVYQFGTAIHFVDYLFMQMNSEVQKHVK